jgi:hypothetical protein
VIGDHCESIDNQSGRVDNHSGSVNYVRRKNR